MRKRILYICMVLVLFLSSVSVVFADGKEARSSSLITVPITVVNLASDNANGLTLTNFTATYDPTRANIVYLGGDAKDGSTVCFTYQLAALYVTDSSNIKTFVHPQYPPNSFPYKNSNYSNHSVSASSVSTGSITASLSCKKSNGATISGKVTFIINGSSFIVVVLS